MTTVPLTQQTGWMTTMQATMQENSNDFAQVLQQVLLLLMMKGAGNGKVVSCVTMYGIVTSACKPDNA